MQSALPVVRQGQGQSQEQLNVVFVVNVILKMGLPVFMADDDGFRSRLAMLNQMLVMAQYNIARHGGVETIEVSIIFCNDNVICLVAVTAALALAGSWDFSGVCSSRAGPA